MTGSRSAAGPRKRHASQLFKTDMCKFFLQNRCQNGYNCPFAHTTDEVRQKPDLTRTSMCKAMAAVGSCTDPTCRFAHDEAQLRATHGFFKMKMCSFAQSGRCKHGESCRFAHSPEELRQAKPAGVEDESLMQQLHVTMPQSHQPAASTRRADLVPENNRARGGAAGGAAASQEFNINNFFFGKQGDPSHLRSKVKGSEQHRQRCQTNQPLSRCRAPQPNGANSSRRNDSADASSWASGSSATEFPGTEHTGSQPTTSDSSSTNNVHTTGGSSSAGTTTALNPSGELCSKRKPQKPPKEAMVTTLLVINIPIYFTQGALLSMLEDLTQSMRGNYDFYYCPWDEREGRNKGYAILNFPDPNHALDFQQHWSNRSVCPGTRREKPLRVMKASVQGFQANVEYFSRVEITACSDLRFRPLYRDAKSILQPLPLQVSPHSEEQLVEPPPTFLAETGMEVAMQESFQGGSGDVSFGQRSRAPVYAQSSRSASQSYGPVGFNGARQMQGQPTRHSYDRSAMPQQFSTSEAACGSSSQLPHGFPRSADAESHNIAMQSAASFAGDFSVGAGGKEEYWMALGTDIATVSTDRDAAAAGGCAQQVLTRPKMMMTPVPWPMGPLVEAHGQRAAISTEVGPYHDSAQDEYLAGVNNCASPRMGTQSGDHNTGHPGKTQQVLYHPHMSPYMMTVMEPMMPADANGRQVEQSSISPTGSMMQMIPNMWFNTDEVYTD